MDLGLTGRNCIVLGASRGIGRAIAQGLATEGARLALCARDATTLDEFAATLRAAGTTVHAEPCDIGDPSALARFLDGAHAALGGTDVLVANASALAGGPDLAAWEAAIRVDLLATVRACEHVRPWLAVRGGAILIVSSISGLETNPMPDYAYTTIKAALNAYTKKLSSQLAPQGVRVNAVAPGAIYFEGGFWDKVKREQQWLYDAVVKTIPSGRYGTPEEVADAAVYLVSARASWVTGECLVVDGGQLKAMR